MEKFDENKLNNSELPHNESADVVVDLAIARMKAGAVVKEERKQRIKFVLIAALCITGLALFASMDFVYQSPDSSTAASGATTVTLNQGPGGHYMASGKINGKSVKFLVDTGATDVAIPMSVAKRIELPLGTPFQTITANGRGTAYETAIKTIELGDIKLSGVKASVTDGLTGEAILLGMSFLRKTKVVTEKGVMKITY